MFDTNHQLGDWWLMIDIQIMYECVFFGFYFLYSENVDSKKVYNLDTIDNIFLLDFFNAILTFFQSCIWFMLEIKHQLIASSCLKFTYIDFQTSTRSYLLTFDIQLLYRCFFLYINIFLSNINQNYISVDV